MPRPLDILLVEDEGDISGPLREVLQEEGHEVVLAQDGGEALQQVESRGFDLVIADVRLPKVDGLTIARRVREQWPKSQVILMSAYGTIPEVRGDDPQVRYFAKPFDLDAFLDTVASLAEP